MAYDSDINLHGRTDPQRIGEPRLIPAVDQRLPNVIRANDASDSDDDAETEEDADSYAVSEGHF